LEIEWEHVVRHGDQGTELEVVEAAGHKQDVDPLLLDLARGQKTLPEETEHEAPIDVPMRLFLQPRGVRQLSQHRLPRPDNDSSKPVFLRVKSAQQFLEVGGAAATADARCLNA